MLRNAIILLFGIIVLSLSCFGEKDDIPYGFGVSLIKLRKKLEVKRTIRGMKVYGGCFDLDKLEKAKQMSDDLVFQDAKRNGREAKTKLNFPQQKRWAEISIRCNTNFLEQGNLLPTFRKESSRPIRTQKDSSKVEFPIDICPKYEKAAYYDENGNFSGFYPISAVEKKPNKPIAVYVVTWKDGEASHNWKIKNQLLKKELCKFEIGDLVRLENDIGLIIDGIINTKTEQNLYRIQWLENGRAVSVKPAESIVLFQKAYATHESIDSIQDKYEKGTTLKLESKELRMYKWAVYHEDGHFYDFYRITGVEFDEELQMYRVLWEDKSTIDNLKSSNELYEKRPKCTAQSEYFSNKIETLDPQVQTPKLLAFIKRKRRRSKLPSILERDEYMQKKKAQRTETRAPESGKYKDLKFSKSERLDQEIKSKMTQSRESRCEFVVPKANLENLSPQRTREDPTCSKVVVWEPSCEKFYFQVENLNEYQEIYDKEKNN